MSETLGAAGDISRRVALGVGAAAAIGLDTVSAQRRQDFVDQTAGSRGNGFSIAEFGARTDASGSDNFAAFKRCLIRCLDYGVPLWIPAGRFEMCVPPGADGILDPTRFTRGARRAISIMGMGGPESSVLSLGAGRGLHFATMTDWFDLALDGFSVVGNTAGALLAIGRDDFADPLNMLHIRDVYVENGLKDPRAVALRLNYVAPGAYAIGLKCNVYSDQGKINVGTAVEFRQVECMTLIGGALGNAAVGVKIDGGVSFGLVFSGLTFENCNVGVQHVSRLSGAHSFQGCQFSNIVEWPIQSMDANTSEWIEFSSCNFALPSDLVDPHNCAGVRISDRRNLITPPVPASGRGLANSTGRHLDVYIWGGAISRIAINGSSMPLVPPNAATPIFLRLAPGCEIAMDWTFVPSWAWHNGG